jgi:hypothetical protein
MIVTRSNVTLSTAAINNNRIPRSAVFCYNATIIRIEYHTALQCNNQQCLSQRHPSHRRRHGNCQPDTTVATTTIQTTVATTTATKTVATTHNHVDAYLNNLGIQKPRCSTAMLAGSAPKPRCSTAMLDSSPQQTRCSTVRLDSHAARQQRSTVPRWQVSAIAPHIASAIVLTYSVTINQLCLPDNCPMRQPTAVVSTTAMRRTIHSFCYCAHILCDNQPSLSLRQLSYAATNGLCLRDSHMPNHTTVFVFATAVCQTIMANGQWPSLFAFLATTKQHKNDRHDHMPRAAFICI